MMKVKPDKVKLLVGSCHMTSTLRALCSESHVITKSDPFTYIISERYISDEFYEIMIDTEVLKQLIARYRQYLAYKKQVTYVKINKTKVGAINVQFDIGFISFIVDIPIGIIEFNVVEADTPFLLCLKDMDKLNVYFNNFITILITSTKLIPVVCCFGHPSYLQDESLLSFIANSFNNNPCFLTDIKLR